MKTRVLTIRSGTRSQGVAPKFPQLLKSFNSQSPNLISWLNALEHWNKTISIDLRRLRWDSHHLGRPKKLPLVIGVHQQSLAKPHSCFNLKVISPSKHFYWSKTIKVGQSAFKSPLKVTLVVGVNQQSLAKSHFCSKLKVAVSFIHWCSFRPLLVVQSTFKTIIYRHKHDLSMICGQHNYPEIQEMKLWES